MNKRFEDKYLLGERESYLFKVMNRAYLVKDEEALRFNQSHIYHINSTYYDTPTFTSYNQKINGEKNKFKFRVRDYGTQEKYLELKIKEGVRGEKFRVKNQESLSETYKQLLAKITISKAIQFSIPLSFSILSPRLKVSYTRESYRLALNENVKVNIDRDIQFSQLRSERNFRSNQKVLEVKYNRDYDKKLLNFNKSQTEFSKYQKGLESVYFLN